MCSAGLLCSVSIACSNDSDVVAPPSSGTATAPPCATDALAVAVRFATAVQANDIDVYSACESATSPPASGRIDTLATFGTLRFEDASKKGTTVDVPAPPIPNGDLPPHQCGVNVVVADETNGWFVTDVTFYCSA